MKFDYAAWKSAPAKGIRGANHKFLLGSLFYDQEWREDLAKYVLSAEDYETPSGKVLPSAYQIVVYATDEYTAMQKLVGNLEQWEKLKELEWFGEWLERALREQEARIISAIRTSMVAQAMDGDNQSARTVLAIDKERSKRPVGRPAGKSKSAAAKAKVPKADTGDASRIMSFKK